MEANRIPCDGCELPITDPGEGADAHAMLCDSCYDELTEPGAKVKPGMRCECRDAQCNEHLEHNAHYPSGQCYTDSVRMVTVRAWHADVPESERVGMGLTPRHEPGDGDCQVPMCAACADWAEKGASK